MKMLEPYLNQVYGVDLFSAFSLLIFMAVFVWLVVWVWKTDKNFIHFMKNLPVEEDSKPQTDIKKE